MAVLLGLLGPRAASFIGDKEHATDEDNNGCDDDPGHLEVLQLRDALICRVIYANDSSGGADDRNEREHDQDGFGALKVLGEPRDQGKLHGNQGRSPR
ncbi:MAG: hypothetical protein ACT4P3_02930 [Betaproteobacteria bacterium]